MRYVIWDTKANAPAAPLRYYRDPFRTYPAILKLNRAEGWPRYDFRMACPSTPSRVNGGGGDE